MADQITPMMKQYRHIKTGLAQDVILFFRLGDFYEMFFDDAKVAAPILDIALTKRNNVPMCGIPFHSVDAYLAKLIKAGKKVAICEQMEDASESKGIVRREITRIVTPGTVTFWPASAARKTRSGLLCLICRQAFSWAKKRRATFSCFVIFCAGSLPPNALLLLKT